MKSLISPTPTTMTTVAPTPAASNAPAPARRYGPFLTWLRRLLGVADVVHNYDALAMTLSVRDIQIERDRQLLREVVKQLNLTTAGAMRAEDRLAFHEKRVPGLLTSRKRYDTLLAKKERLQSAPAEPAAAEPPAEPPSA